MATKYGEKIAKMEKDIEYIRISIDDLRSENKELREVLQNQFITFSNELDKKVDRTEMWKILSLIGGFVTIVFMILQLFLR